MNCRAVLWLARQLCLRLCCKTLIETKYVNSEHRTLLVPIAKSGKATLIRLNSAALELLRSMPRLENYPIYFPRR